MQSNQVEDPDLNCLIEQFSQLGVDKSIVEILYQDNDKSFDRTVSQLAVIVEDMNNNEMKNTQNQTHASTTNIEETIDFLYHMFLLQTELTDNATSGVKFERDVIALILEESENNVNATLRFMLNATQDTEGEVEEENNEDDVRAIEEILLSEEYQQQQQQDNQVSKPKQKKLTRKEKEKLDKKKAKQNQKNQQRYQSIQQLADMFPMLDEESVRSVFIACDNNVESAFHLLSEQMNLRDILPKEDDKKKKPQKRDDLVGWKQGLTFNHWQNKPVGVTCATKKKKTEDLTSYLEQRQSETDNDISTPPSVTSYDLASELKLKKLYQMFQRHGINDSVIEKEFVASGFQISTTVKRIHALYPHLNTGEKITQTVIAPHIATLIAQQKKEKRQQESMQVAEPHQKDYSEAIADRSQISYSREKKTSNDYRREGNDYSKLRNQFFSMAVLAFQRGDGKMAKELAARGRDAAAKSKQAHVKASNLIYEQSNSPSSNTTIRTIDLHGLRVYEALDILEQVISEEKLEQEKDEMKARRLHVITGVGHHSAKGRARIKPAVEQYLRSNNYKYKEIYSGAIQVTILR